MLEQVFLCLQNKNGLLCTHTVYGIAVTLNVDHVKDPLTLLPIPDGQYDSHEDLVTRFSTLDKLVCGYNPPPRNSPAEIVEMTTVLETLQKMDNVVMETYSVPKTPNSGIQGLVNALIAALRRLGYLSSLFDTPGIYSELIQIAVQKFQTDYNTNCENATPQLPCNGLLCPNTWQAIQNKLVKGSIAE